MANQASLFEQAQSPGLRLEEAEPMNSEEKLKWEKELLGVYVSGHPLEKYKEKMRKAKWNISSIKKLRKNTPVILISMVDQIRKILTKKGDPMVFLKLTDFTGNIESVVFPRVLENCGHFLQEDKCVIIRGKINIRNNEPSIVCEDIKELTHD